MDMSGVWREDDDETYRVGGGRISGGTTRSKPRFTFTEVKLLLDEVKRNRYILLKRFNNGVSADAKKQTWAEITELINDLGENHREVRQIMKKWADLKCDGKRRIAALRGTNSSTLKKKTLGPVERMVHKILLMAPGSDNNSDLEWDDDDEMDLKKWQLAKGIPPPPTPAFSYLSTVDNPLTLPGGNSFDATSFDVSPLSTPEKEPSGDPFHASSDVEFDPIEDDFDADDKEMDSLFPRLGPGGPPSSASLPPLDPLLSSGEALLKFKPTRHTYSRSLPNPSPRPPLGPPLTSSSPFLPPTSNSPSSSLPMPTSAGREDAPPPPSASLSATNGTTFHPAAGGASSSSSVFPPPPSSSPAAFPPPPPPHSYSQPAPHLSHAPSSSAPPRPQLSQLATQSLQQQHASRLLLSSVSHSLESLAQSVQLLVESQQEYVQESLHMQRETVDILKDFAGTVLAMLGDKTGGGGSAGSGGTGTGQRP